MAHLLARMTAALLGLAACLLACLFRVLAQARAVALTPAMVRATTKHLPTGLTAPHVVQPARLVLESPLAAHANLLGQKGAFGTGLIVPVAIVRHLRMSTGFGSPAVESTSWRLGAAGQGRLKHGLAAVAADILKHGLPAAGARTLVAEFRTAVIGALQRPTADARTDVLGLKALVDQSRSGVQRTQLPLEHLPLCRFSLSRTASLAAFMTAAIQGGFADARAPWSFHVALMTDAWARHSSAATTDGDGLETW